MSDRTLVMPAPGTGRTGPTARETAVATEGYRRLSVVTGIVVGATVIVGIVWIIELVAGEVERKTSDVAGILTVLILAVAATVMARRQRLPARAFVPFAIGTEFLVAAALSGPIMGWQHRLGADTLAWLRGTGPEALALGAGIFPLASLWIMLFATIIPMRPRLHLWGAAASTAAVMGWPFVSLWVLGTPTALASEMLGFTIHVSVWLGFRTAIASGMAYFAARSVYGLRKQLDSARRMGSYHLRTKLGEGGMGEVWVADHEMLARSAAIKLVRHAGDAAHSVTDDMLHRFEREVRATAHLRSPHTIEIYDYGLADDGTFFYVMELLDGLDLDALVKEHGPQPWPRVVAILSQVCHSLGEAHERGLVHRDIKPANIFLCHIGRDVDQVKVLDFGLVKMTGDADGHADLTRQGMFVGTPAFAPPEQAQEGVDAIDARGDIYSLGCVAFWLLTGRLVFEGKTPVEMLISHARDEAPPPSQVTELDIPDAFDTLVLRCLAKDLHDRPSSADDLLASLEALEADWTEPEARGWWSQHRRTAPEHGSQ